MSQPRIGFIGIGAMGFPMGSRVLKAGFPLVVYDAAPGVGEKFAREVGGRAAASLAALAAESDIVITMLPNSEIVEQVLFAPEGVAAGLKKGAIVVEMSSGVPMQTAAMGRRLAERGIAMIDAPVSGGVRKAITGELAIMAGGDDKTVDACTPLLQSMGARIFRTGALGSGQAMKALNNLVSAAGFVAGIEALLIGKRFGLDPARMVEVLNASTGKNNSTEHKFAQFVLSRQFNAGFSLDLMVKDVSIALGLARETGTTAMQSSVTRELWAAAGVELGKGVDHTEVTKLLEKLAGEAL